VNFTFSSMIPWSWLWRRGIVLLLVGVIIFSLFFNNPKPLRDPPVLKNAELPSNSTEALRNEKNISETTDITSKNAPITISSSQSTLCTPCSAEIACSSKRQSYIGESTSASYTKPPMEVAYRRELASTISYVERQITRMAGHRAVIDAKLALILRGLVEELDPRRVSLVSATYQLKPSYSFINKTRHVCPEVLMGRRYDHPYYQHGIESQNCSNVPKLSQVLSIILPAHSWRSAAVSFVISKIREVYDIPIIAVVSNVTRSQLRNKGVKIVVSNKNYSEGTVLNQLVKHSKTPFVFLGTSLSHFSNQSSLERLVRVLDEVDHVKVAGGAARDLKGHWIHGCLQVHIANYKASYKLGYYHSSNDCMHCDDLLTPFITTRKLINRIPFRDELNGPALYRDWFVRVREAGHLIVTCPDVMFFINSHIDVKYQNWLSFAQRWALQTVESYTGDRYKFPCEGIGIGCNKTHFITKSLLLPPCCIASAHHDIGMLVDFAESLGLDYELQAGSVLGAVKFGAFLPWDVDHDIYVNCKDFKKWSHQFSAFAKTYKCTPKIKYKNSFLKIMCPSFTLDILCRNQLSKKFLPLAYQNTSTHIWYGGRWTKVMSNPGLFSRNSLGYGILKHVQHSSHFTKTDRSRGYGKPGIWHPCKTPKHHSCLDRYPADGNLPFL
ncbi:hypothetical protein SK128_002662, partial [Halocaridina rubra]